jgi:hypothetical protein
MPIEQVQALTFPRAPLSGLLEFTASGAGNFDAPRYEVRGRVADLFAGEEGIGQVTGRLSVRGDHESSLRLVGRDAGVLRRIPGQLRRLCPPRGQSETKRSGHV